MIFIILKLQSRKLQKLETFQLTGQFQTEIKQFIVKLFSNSMLPKNTFGSNKIEGQDLHVGLTKRFSDIETKK